MKGRTILDVLITAAMTVGGGVLIMGLYMLRAWCWVRDFFKKKEKVQNPEYYFLGEGVSNVVFYNEANSNTRACELDPRNKLCYDGKPDCCLKDRVKNGE